MLLSAVSVLVVAQSSSEIPEGLINNPVCHDARSTKYKISNEHVAPIFRVKHSTLIILRKSEEEGRTLHRSVGNVLPFDASQHPRCLEYSLAPH